MSSLFDMFKGKKRSAETAKNRLQILISQERVHRGEGPDYLPLLHRELLEVIKKYVNVDSEAVKVHLLRDGNNDVLDITVALPEENQRDTVVSPTLAATCESAEAIA